MRLRQLDLLDPVTRFFGEASLANSIYGFLREGSATARTAAARDERCPVRK
jgi:hypothetical protein